MHIVLKTKRAFYSTKAAGQELQSNFYKVITFLLLQGDTRKFAFAYLHDKTASLAQLQVLI